MLQSQSDHESAQTEEFQDRILSNHFDKFLNKFIHLQFDNLSDLSVYILCLSNYTNLVLLIRENSSCYVNLTLKKSFVF